MIIALKIKIQLQVVRYKKKCCPTPSIHFLSLNISILTFFSSIWEKTISDLQTPDTFFSPSQEKATKLYIIFPVQYHPDQYYMSPSNTPLPKQLQYGGLDLLQQQDFSFSLVIWQLRQLYIRAVPKKNS